MEIPRDIHTLKTSVYLLNIANLIFRAQNVKVFEN